LLAVIRLAAVNCLVLGLLVLGAEAGLRIARIHYPAIADAEDNDRGVWTYDATKGWIGRRHSQGSSHIAGGADRAAVRINSLGVRGGEIAADPPGGFGRVLVLGDSFGFGVGLDEDHTVAAFLQHQFAVNHVTADVTSMSLSGYSTDQELILFKEAGARLLPKIVVLLMCDNDFEENARDFEYLSYYKPYFTLAGTSLVAHNSPAPMLTAAQRARLWLGQDSELWNFVRSRESATPPFQAALNLFEVALPRATADDPYALTAALLRELQRQVQLAGGRLVIANAAQRGEHIERFVRLRRHYLRPEGFDFMRMEDTLEPARLAQPTKRWDFAKDRHWDADASALAAEAIYKHLGESGLLPAGAQSVRSASTGSMDAMRRAGTSPAQMLTSTSTATDKTKVALSKVPMP
jgi:hypothetical protein